MKFELKLSENAGIEAHIARKIIITSFLEAKKLPEMHFI
jgi:hypothetical protein